MAQKKSLFPSANTTQPTLFPTTSAPAAALFPSAPAALFPATPTTLPPAPADEPQGWLRNSSFPNDLVNAANSVVPSAPRLVTLNAPPPPAKKNKRRKTDDDRKKKKKKKEKKEQELITPFDIFELHTKPEKDNYRYGSLYSYDIPNYKAHIKWCVGAGKQEMTAAARSKQKHDSSSDPNLR
eukprot:sb/3471616/